MKEKNLFPFWSEDWMKLQKQYFDVWAAMQGDVADKLMPKRTNPWAETLEQWQRFLRSRDKADVSEHMVAQAKAFFQLGEEFIRFLKTASELGKASDDWRTLLKERFEEVKSAFSSFRTQHKEHLGGLAAFWNLPLDTWRRTVSGASLLPGDVLQSLKPDVWESVSEGLHDRMERFLSVPGVGYTRESQEQMQEAMRLVVDYQRAWQEYANVHARLGINTLERLTERVIQGIEQGEELKSLREIYELWVDCGEEIYLGYVSTEEYAEIYARMVNALMALKRQGRGMADEGLSALGMPTRRGFDTIQRRQQELRRQVVELKANREQHDRIITRLERELAELRQVLADRDGGGVSRVNDALAAKAAAKRKTPKKRTPARQSAKTGRANEVSLGE